MLGIHRKQPICYHVSRTYLSLTSAPDKNPDKLLSGFSLFLFRRTKSNSRTSKQWMSKWQIEIIFFLVYVDRKSMFPTYKLF